MRYVGQGVTRLIGGPGVAVALKSRKRDTLQDFHEPFAVETQRDRLENFVSELEEGANGRKAFSGSSFSVMDNNMPDTGMDPKKAKKTKLANLKPSTLEELVERTIHLSPEIND